MLKITVKLFAMLSKFAKNQSIIEIEVKDNASIKEVIEMIGLPEDEIFNCTINGRNSDFTDIVTDGDTVGFYPYLGGG